MGKLGRLGFIGLRIGMVGIDAVLIVASLLASIWLRFDYEPVNRLFSGYTHDHFAELLILTAGSILLLFHLGMYRYAWLHAGIEALRSLLIASTLWSASLVIVFGNHLPRSVVLIFWLVSTLAIGSFRVAIRLVASRLQDRTLSHDNGNRDASDSGNGNGGGNRNGNGNGHGSPAARHTRALIVGDAEYVVGMIKGIQHAHVLRHYDLVGLLDSHSERHGMVYCGVKVLGSPDILAELIESRLVDEVIFAVSDESDGAEIRQKVIACRMSKVPAKIIPDVSESLTKPNLLRLDDIQVEDLLRRPMRGMDVESFAGYIRGRRVLVTGAGGSIGSEICQQVMRMSPAELVLLGHGENSIFRIQQDLRHSYPEFSDKLFAVIASVTDADRISGVFNRFKPDVVFHAAAHKHLPLMEYNVCEAVHNNVVGTYAVIQACVENGVDRLVQISTDKAADPSSVMGATKYLCECLIRGASTEYQGTDFVCVRFGNVLGSRGSVIPLFSAQIRSGGPVTVTHPEMTRYFMTIPEAVRLVIQAGAVGKSGEVYLLDMGKPVKILDLAEDMIRLNGLEPNFDIPIVFTGVRPGEKMHEQLVGKHEQIKDSGYDCLTWVKCETLCTWDDVVQLVGSLRGMAESMDGRGILSAFAEHIPGYSNSTRAASCKLAA